MKKQKIYVLDTSVLFHDDSSIEKFGSHDVCIPMDVIGEIDRHKDRNDSVGANARAVTRFIDERFSQEIFTKGVSLGHSKGNLFLYPLFELNPRVKKAYKNDCVDHRIISVALNLKEKKGQTKVIIVVSNDANLRFKAGAFGLDAQQYKNDRVETIDDLYKGFVSLDDISLDSIIDTIYQKREIDVFESELLLSRNFYPNQFVLLKCGDKTALSRFYNNKLILVGKESIYGRLMPKNAEQTLALNALLNPDIMLVTLNGPAGTGKTLLAIGAAVSQTKIYDQIVVARPIVAMSNKDLGYLPGDAQDKVAPYMQPIYDNLRFLKQANGGEQKKKSTFMDEMLEEGKIKVEPLAYIRGRTMPNTLLIIDEAQNLTPNEIKTIVTRMGECAKIILTGDIYQIDHPYLDAYSNGLSYLIEKAKEYEYAAHITLEKGERSPLSDWAAKNL